MRRDAIGLKRELIHSFSYPFHPSYPWSFNIPQILIFSDRPPSASERESSVTDSTPKGQGANRLKNDESFQRGRSSRLATRSNSFATKLSNSPAAFLSTG